jgi:hypothetical protein
MIRTSVILPEFAQIDKLRLLDKTSRGSTHIDPMG